MIGLFDSGHGGLTVLRALAGRFDPGRFVYLGDHARAPYGNKSSEEIVELTRQGVETLFGLGCPLVLLACNTATAVAARRLQREWLPGSPWAGSHNVIGIIAPTVEAATQTPWAVTTPQYPQKHNTDTIAVLATRRTVASGVYREEIRKRCPKVKVVEQACPELAGMIEAGAAESVIDAKVAGYVSEMMQACQGTLPHRAILGCTHYVLIEHLFRRHLSPFTRLLSQPELVADSLEDYLARHPRYLQGPVAAREPTLLTTGEADEISAALAVFWPEHPAFERLDFRHPAVG
ncbi:MAG: aspartate/glutamate racemase family protein [Hyphomicrobiaceae bacterium]